MDLVPRDSAVVNLATMDQKGIFPEIEGHQEVDSRTSELVNVNLKDGIGSKPGPPPPSRVFNPEPYGGGQALNPEPLYPSLSVSSSAHSRNCV